MTLAKKINILSYYYVFLKLKIGKSLHAQKVIMLQLICEFVHPFCPKSEYLLLAQLSEVLLLVNLYDFVHPFCPESKYLLLAQKSEVLLLVNLS